MPTNRGIEIFRSGGQNWSRDIGISGTHLSVDTFLSSGRNTFRISSFAMCSLLLR
jgi:hypothetical protein